MAFEYGFFNSVNGDRLYNSDQISTMFEGLLTNGVYESVGNKMAVEPNEGMVIQINTGRGYFNGRWAKNTSAYLITLADSDVTLNRYAAVCIRVDQSDSVRSVTPVVIYSEFATNPAKPSMTRSELINEYCLAYVYIKAGATAITAANIEDTRNDSNLCGWVTGLIDQLDSSTLYTQFTAIFNEWFSAIQDDLDMNTKTMLVAALPTAVSVTLLASGWSGKSQTVTVTGVNATKSVLIQSDDSSVDAFTTAGVKCTAQGANSLTFTCTTVPTESITVKVLHMGK